MDTTIEQSLAKRLDALLGDIDSIDEPEMSECRGIYEYVRDSAHFGGLQGTLDTMCETEEAFPGRVYPCYQDVRDIVFGEPELVPMFLDRYKMLCLWRINHLKEQPSA